MKWMHEGGGAQGLLTTAGGLLFGNDGSTNFCAFDAATGKILWHTWMPVLPTNGAPDLPAGRLSVHHDRRPGHGLRLHAEQVKLWRVITLQALTFRSFRRSLFRGIALAGKHPVEELLSPAATSNHSGPVR